ncbi:MAG: hypothetical protein HYY16_01420 [Planctomycetes bacterium]|nr:hypothetical protein [Planctomycetota bacterium]
MHPEEAEEHLAVIRSMMERTTRYTGVPAYACFAAGALALAGAGASAALHIDFNSPIHQAPLTLIWGGVCLLGAVQFVTLTVWSVRRRGEPAWTRLTQRVVTAVLPGTYVGAALTEFCRQTGNLDYLPPFWCLCYGAACLGLGLYAGWKANLVGCLFLAAGTLGLYLFKDQGIALMAAAFGGLHLLLGALILLGHDPPTRED